MSALRRAARPQPRSTHYAWALRPPPTIPNPSTMRSSTTACRSRLAMSRACQCRACAGDLSLARRRHAGGVLDAAGVDQCGELIELKLLPISAVVWNPAAVVGTAVSISAAVATTVLVLGTVAITVSITGTHRVDLYEVSVVVDVDMVANAAPAGVEAVRQARPLDADIAVAMLVQGLLGLIHRVRASGSGTENQKSQTAANNAKFGLPQHDRSPHATPLTRSATAPQIVPITL